MRFMGIHSARTERLSTLWLLVALLAAAMVARISFLEDSRFMAERQYRSAVLARVSYLEHVEDEPRWRSEIAQVSARRMGVLEPPVMEALAVLGYRLAGAEKLWIPRLLAATFWVMGGVFVFALSRRLTGEPGAVVATAYYLFLPLGVSVSVSFIPDALMLMLFTASLLAIYLNEEQPSWRRLFVAGLLAGSCVLVKPVCIFAIAGAFIALRLHFSGVRGLFAGPTVVFGLFLASPAIFYYAYGMFLGGFLSGQKSASFIPALLFQPRFWLDTGKTALAVIGPVPASLALLAFAFCRQTAFRSVVLGLVAAHFVLCVVFTYHVRMAGHYHLPLAVPVALCLGPIVAAFVEMVLRQSRPKSLGFVCLAGAFIISVTVIAPDIRSGFRSRPPIVEPAVARAVGEAVRHSDRVVYVSQYYGAPLEYYGELSGWYWQRPASSLDRVLYRANARERSIEERLATLGTAQSNAEADFEPEFFVVTDFRQFARHDDLAAYLTQHCQPIVNEVKYLIFGRCELP